MRLKAAYMSSQNNIRDTNGVPYLDVGITKWNLRPRKIEGNPHLQTIDIDNIGFNLADFKTMEEQSKYKYILHISGHVSAFRLSMELAMKSVILMVESEWKLWYSDMLKPYVHYVPVAWDLSNLNEIIRWCKENDEQCKKIAENARIFYDKFLSRDSILDYMQKLIIDSASLMNAPPYPKQTVLETMLDIESEYVEKQQSKWKIQTDEYTTPTVFRTHKLLSRTHEEVKKILTESSFETEAQRGYHIFSNKLSRVVGCVFNGIKMAVKCTNDERKIREHIHESYVGTTAINNMLRYIPNFAYTFGSYQTEDTKKIITEFIPGMTLHEYINSDKFKFAELRIILMQLFLALEMAQNKYGFIHNDLTPWNVIIYRPLSMTTIDYQVANGKVFTIKTNAIPVMIDFGKSKIVVENVHHDFPNVNQKSTIQDVISLILTTVKNLISKRLPKEDFTKCLSLVNYLGGTKYLPSQLCSARDLNMFLKRNAKYSDLLSSPKYELEEKGPMDFVKIFQRYVYISEGVVFNPCMQQHY